MNYDIIKLRSKIDESSRCEKQFLYTFDEILRNKPNRHRFLFDSQVWYCGWRVDFVVTYVEGGSVRKMIVELDGQQHYQGGIDHDAERDLIILSENRDTKIYRVANTEFIRYPRTNCHNIIDLLQFGDMGTIGWYVDDAYEIAGLTQHRFVWWPTEGA